MGPAPGRAVHLERCRSLLRFVGIFDRGDPLRHARRAPLFSEFLSSEHLPNSASLPSADRRGNSALAAATELDRDRGRADAAPGLRGVLAELLARASFLGGLSRRHLVAGGRRAVLFLLPLRRSRCSKEPAANPPRWLGAGERRNTHGAVPSLRAGLGDLRVHPGVLPGG